MTKFYAAAAVLAIVAGAPFAATAAEDEGTRKIAVEPAGSGVETFIIAEPDGVGSETGGTPIVQPIVVQPEGTPGPIAGTDLTPINPVEPEPFRPETVPQPEPRFERIAQPEPAFETAPRPEPTFEQQVAAPPVNDPNAGARALFEQLVANGYTVDILKRDAYGRLVFDVTNGGKVGHVLLIDAAEGTIYEQRQYRTASADSYAAYEPAPRHTNYTPRVRYTQPRHADNCGSATAYRY